MNPADLFAHQTDTITLVPGHALFHEGDAGDAMFVLLEGIMEIRVGEKVVETSVRGAILGEMAEQTAGALRRAPSHDSFFVPVKSDLAAAPA